MLNGGVQQHGILTDLKAIQLTHGPTQVYILLQLLGRVLLRLLGCVLRAPGMLCVHRGIKRYTQG